MKMKTNIFVEMPPHSPLGAGGLVVRGDWTEDCTSVVGPPSSKLEVVSLSSAQTSSVDGILRGSAAPFPKPSKCQVLKILIINQLNYYKHKFLQRYL